MFSERFDNPLRYLHHARNDFCAGHPECNGVCAVAFKLFDNHGVHGTRLQSLLGNEATQTVVLERDPAHAECSLNWAKQTDDWETSPLAHAEMMKAMKLTRRSGALTTGQTTT